MSTAQRSHRVWVIAAVVLVRMPALGSEKYVNKNATGANNGSTWQDAFVDLQTVLTAAANGDQVWVAEGTYSPAPPGGPTTATFRLKGGVEVYGGFSGNESALQQRDFNANPTILNGDLNFNDSTASSDCCTPHQFPGCDDASCMNTVCGYDSFCCATLWDGQCAARANLSCDPTCVSVLADNSLTVVTALPNNMDTILDGFVIMRGGQPGTNFGGGALFDLARGQLRNCVFRENHALHGAGAYATNSNITIENCVFEANVGRYGAALRVDGFVGTVLGTTFRNNIALDAGGAVFGTSPLTFERSQFLANSARIGGALFTINGDVTLRSCAVLGNSADSAAAWYSGGGNARLLNCAVRGNVGAGGAVTISGGSATFRDSILWGNGDFTESAQLQFVSGATIFVDYSCFEGWTGVLGGVGNVGTDPLFESGDPLTYQLNECSPLVNGGDPDFVPAPGETDLDGASRLFGPRVDIGADEVAYPDDDQDGFPDYCDTVGSCCTGDGTCIFTAAEYCPGS